MGMSRRDWINLGFCVLAVAVILAELWLLYLFVSTWTPLL